METGIKVKSCRIEICCEENIFKDLCPRFLELSFTASKHDIANHYLFEIKEPTETSVNSFFKLVKGSINLAEQEFDSNDDESSLVISDAGNGAKLLTDSHEQLSDKGDLALGEGKVKRPHASALHENRGVEISPTEAVQENDSPILDKARIENESENREKTTEGEDKLDCGQDNKDRDLHHPIQTNDSEIPECTTRDSEQEQEQCQPTEPDSSAGRDVHEEKNSVQDIQEMVVSCPEQEKPEIFEEKKIVLVPTIRDLGSKVPENEVSYKQSLTVDEDLENLVSNGDKISKHKAERNPDTTFVQSNTTERDKTRTREHEQQRVGIIKERPPTSVAQMEETNQDPHDDLKCNQEKTGVEMILNGKDYNKAMQYFHDEHSVIYEYLIKASKTGEKSWRIPIHDDENLKTLKDFLKRIKQKEKNIVSKKDDLSLEEDKYVLKLNDIQKELALAHFEESNISQYFEFKDEYWEINSHHVKPCVFKDLQKFMKSLVEKKVPPSKHRVVNEIKKRFEAKVNCEHQEEGILLITIEKYHEEILKKYPDLYDIDVQPSSSLSTKEKKIAKSSSVNQAKEKESGITQEPEKSIGQQLGSKSPDKFTGPYSNLVVTVFKADITQLKVDVIVNAANGKLAHSGGVARVISKAAGEKLKKECKEFIEGGKRVAVSYHFVSSGGNLPADKVYHAVGPRWSDYSHHQLYSCKCDLRMTILRCLVHAEEDGHRTIAFPSISAALFKVPKEICLESYMKAVQVFDKMRRTKRKRLQEVMFVDIDDFMVNSIKEHFSENWHIHLDDDEFRYDERHAEDYLRDVSSTGYSKSNASVPSYADAARKSQSHSELGMSRTTPSAPLITSPDISAQSTLTENPDQAVTRPKSEARGGYRDISSSGAAGKCRLKMTMMLVRTPYHVEGFSHPGYFEITYNSEIERHAPYSLTAYIPCTQEGWNCVQLLLLAFKRHLIFKKPTSTTEEMHSHVWNNFPYITSLNPYDRRGYLDPDYIKRLSKALQDSGLTVVSMTPSEQDFVSSCEMDLKKRSFCIVHEIF